MTPSTLLTPAERHVMEHALAWNHPATRKNRRRSFWRNHFVTGPGSDDWATLQALCGRGLMRVTRAPSDLSGADAVFGVTEAGVDVLRGGA